MSGQNPFEDSDEPAYTPNRQPAMTNQNAPSVPQRGTMNVDKDLLAKADKLRKKEEELNKREATLDARADILVDREKSLAPARPPNWPPFSFCCIHPIIRHDIVGDIPEPVHRLIAWGWYAWHASVFALLWNFICMCAVLAERGASAVADFFIGLILMILLTLMWFGTFRVLYDACRKAKPSLFLFYLILFTVEICGLGYYCVGFPGTGAGGFFWMIKEFKHSLAVGVMLLISFVFWCLLLGFSIWYWIWVRIHYKNAGGLQKAKAEMQASAWREAANHPELVAQGVNFAASNPGLVAKGVRAAV